MTETHQQLQSIHAMLAAGHRSVHLEKHSLLLIGGVGGLIAAMTEYLITADYFPDTTQQAVALLVWLSFWLGGMAIVDFKLTHRARQQRDETLPFAQAQMTRAWWMLLSMGTLGSFAMFFYGGGGMIYALWIVLLGLGIYLFGLFSRLLVEWIGLATILLGVTGLAAGLPYGATHWLAASCFAIGMPLAGWLSARYGNTGLTGRVLALLCWITLVVAPPLLITQAKWAAASGPDTSPLSLKAPGLRQGEKVLRLAPDTPIALRLDLESPVLTADPQATLLMKLTSPLDVVLVDGKPDGRYRIAEGEWHAIGEGVLDLMIDRVTPQLENDTPAVRAHAIFGKKFIQKEAP